MLDLIKELDLPKWFIGLVVISISLASFIKWLLSESMTWLTPFEIRRRERIKFLKELANDEQDEVIKQVAEENNRASIFYEHTGIKTNSQPQREQLLEIYNRAKPRFGWNTIREAMPALSTDNSGHFSQKVDKLSFVFMTFFIFSALAVLVGGFTFFYSPVPSDFDSHSKQIWKILQSSVFIISFPFAIALFNPAIPMIRALQIKKYI